MTTDYQRGFTDGLGMGGKVNDALKGEDLTAYLFVGGPKDGEFIATRGSQTIYAPIPVSLTATWGPHWEMSTTLPIGRYTRTEGGDPKRTIYVWRGER